MQEFSSRACRSPNAGMMEHLGCRKLQAGMQDSIRWDEGALRQRYIDLSLNEADGWSSLNKETIMDRVYGMWPDLRKDLESIPTY